MVNSAQKTADHFGEKGSKWHLLYERATFKDRLGLFTTGVVEVLSPPSKILDFGCGAGVMSMALAREGYNVTGVDAAEGMVDAAERTRKSKNISNVHFDLDAGDFLGKNKNMYNGIICSSVIEYIEDDLMLIKEIIGSLKPGGFFLLSIPHSESLVGKLEDIVHASNLTLRRPTKPDILYSKRRYNRKKLFEFLREQSLDSFHCKYYELPKLGFWGIPISRMKYFGVMLFVRCRKI